MGTGLIIMLIVLGIILILVEILLIPGFAVTGILGVGSLVLACYFGFTHLGPRAGVIIIVGEVILLSVLLYYALRAKTWKKLSLHTNIDAKVDEHPETKGLTAGMEGVTTTRLNPMGRAKIGGHDLEVRSIDGFVDERTEIVIDSIENEKIFVKKK
ncbi:MAG TPA: NfeD family protein [Bacteroidales bacterium]|nr:NfeD family protein [Bacteroidales bacterium]